MSVLIGMSAEVKGKSFPVDRDEITIGRNADNVIPINNATVSGHHCSIKHDGERLILRDLGSTNGTRVNAKDVKEVVLRPKDILQVGSVEFMYNSNDAVDTSPGQNGSETEVVIMQGGATRPESFSSISPFGARRRENPGPWMVAIVILGILAVGLVGFLMYRLFFA